MEFVRYASKNTTLNSGDAPDEPAGTRSTSPVNIKLPGILFIMLLTDNV